LCVPDQLKLMHFDNHKLTMLTNQWTQKPECLALTLARKFSNVFAKKNESDQMTEFSPPKTVEEFSSRIDRLVEVLI